MAAEMKSPQTFHGSCHCQNIKYTVALTLPSDGPPTGTRCNCTICQKTGFINVRIKESDFHLVSPSSLSDLTDYKMRSPLIHRYICPKCGINVWVQGNFEFMGDKSDDFFLNASTLDQPQEGLDLSTWKIDYFDGLHDNFVGGKKDTPWPGGCP